MLLTRADLLAVASWGQLGRAGWSPARIRAQLDAGRWRRLGHAIVLHNGPLTREHRWLVAKVHAGQRSLLTAFTAAEAFGLTGWERDETHLLVPHGARVDSRGPVPAVAHRCRNWSGEKTARGRPVHTRTSALVLASATFDNPRPACGLLAAAVQQRLVTAAMLADRLSALPRLRHHAVLTAAVADIGQGAQALSEIDFVQLCRRYRLPAPHQQRVRKGRDGRRRYLDASWRRCDGRLVVIEVDGALHLDVRRWWSDQLRQNEVTLGDAVVLRFPSVIVRTEPAVVAEQLRRALRL